MTTPVRIQLSRKRGFNLQQHSRAINGLEAVNCARPGKFGNPYPIINDPTDRQKVVDLFRRLFTIEPNLQRHRVLTIMKGNNGRGEGYISYMREHLSDLRGKNLACFCGLDQPCHADVLLQLANKEPNNG